MIYCKVWPHQIDQFLSVDIWLLKLPNRFLHLAHTDGGAIILGKKLKCERAVVARCRTGSYKWGAASDFSYNIQCFYEAYNELLSKEFVKII